MDDYREYENGVADVLRFVVGDRATVTRNVHVLGRRSGVQRQIDVMARGSMFGLDDVTLAVDCKQWNTPLDVTDVEAFLAFLNDVVADLGMLVTTKGYSAAARTRARDARGVRAEVLTLGELEQWSPAGTAHVSYRLPVDRASDARAAFFRAGLRVRQDAPGLERSSDEIVLVAFRFETGDEGPLGDIAAEALAADDLPVDVAASGKTAAGGTPAHRWLEVVNEQRQLVGLRILVDGETEIERQLTDLAARAGARRESLDVVRPPEWPIKGLFGLPPA